MIAVLADAGGRRLLTHRVTYIPLPEASGKSLTCATTKGTTAGGIDMSTNRCLHLFKVSWLGAGPGS